MIKKGFILSISLIFFSVFPNISGAQTNSEEEYRAYLLALIDLLQQQIVLLQENPAQASSDSRVVFDRDGDFQSFLFDDANDVVAWYEISNLARVQNISDLTHREYFQRFFEIVPDAYDDYFVDLLVYAERENEFDGFVETVPPYRPDTWRFGINEEMFDFSLASAVIGELYIHEFGHIISYEDILGRAEPGTTRCHEFFSDFGCPPKNSYLIDFLDKFWDESDMDALTEADEGESIWLNRELRENFVSEYAGTNPAEDFAESFTSFVLEGRASGSGTAARKVNYFYNFDEMLELREEIRNNL